MNRHSGSVVVACLVCVLLALLGSPGCGNSGSDATDGGTRDAGVIDAESLVPDGGCGARIGVACVIGAPCQKAADCSSEICTAGTCRAVPMTCTDGTKDGTETDTDCGGTSCPPCAVPEHCAANGDCLSGYCDKGTCSPPTPTDSIADDSETDVDCGGAIDSDGNTNPESDGAPACGNGKLCGLASDCTSGVCTGATNARAGTCAAPTDTDGVKNGGETGIDCGGATGALGPVTGSDGAPACPAGQGCGIAADCTSGVCTAMICQAADPTDGVKNGGETDTDCGGTGDGAPPCAPGKMCLAPTDCDSKVCTGGTCVAASATDKVQNGGESDVDCGGTTSDMAPRCTDGLHCANDGDCLAGFCSLLNGTCVDGRSCKGIVTPAQIMDPTGMKDANGDAIGTPDPNGVGESAGIDTCGKGEATDPAAKKQHESCCRALTVPGSTWRLDKYEATSGRVRQFLESLNWDVRTWATAQFDKSFNPITPAGTMLAAQLPINQAGVTTNFLNLLPNGRDTSVPLNAVITTGALVMDTSGDQGCVMSSPTNQLFSAMTYWWDAPTMMEQASSAPRPFTQDYYDIKPMNCMPYYFAAAFCAWDGGRLQLHSEHLAAWGPTPTSPWNQPNLPNPYPGNQKMYTVPACGSLATNGAVACTMDWFNGGQAAGSQGDFYYYPSNIAGIPNNLVPDTLDNGLDLTPYIAAPGRFYLDVTAITSSSFAGGEGWHDMGADMIELDATSAFTGGGSFCDASGVTAPGETSNCTNTNSQGQTVPGILRASNLPPADLLGGSWEGHGVVETFSSGGWSVYRQYGKTGIRCARPAEPAK
jgi:hypothetical protein